MTFSNAAEKSGVPSSEKKNDHSMKDRLKSRQSSELVLAFCGAIGSRINEDILKTFEETLQRESYKVHTVKISQIIIEAFEEGKYGLRKIEGLSDSIKGLSRFERYNQLQQLGTEIRSQLGADTLAKICIEKISILRKRHTYTHEDKVAYLISQIKHPEEIIFFRLVYSGIFYLVGTLCSEDQRKHNLINKEDISETHTIQLIETDRNENNVDGQKLEKVLHSSDFFINNTDTLPSHREDVISRFIGLIHGVNGLTPSMQETGMYAAHTASLRSACLSRQVGASIMDNEGTIIATGCNDVPKFGGGLYNTDCVEDKRCVNYEDKKCFNDYHKDLLAQEVTEKITDKLSIVLNDLTSQLSSEPQQKAIQPLLDKLQKIFPLEATNTIANDTSIKNLIEYSRAIHAEMDAIISLSRKNGYSTSKSTLFTTTYPCHNCARHIVTAGIERVIYIEPYEKSLATKLHNDTIAKNRRDTKKVSFLPFEGVSPRRYSDLFKAHNKRKDQGSAISIKVKQSSQVIPTYIDSYYDRENNVVRSLHEQFEEQELTS